MSNFEEIISNPAFIGLTEEQKNYYKKLMEELQGKNSMETMMIMMEYSKKAPKGVPISKEEQDLMLETVTEGLPQKEKENFLRIVKIMRTL